jgi:hypothetical protein
MSMYQLLCKERVVGFYSYIQWAMTAKHTEGKLPVSQISAWAPQKTEALLKEMKTATRRHHPGCAQGWTAAMRVLQWWGSLRRPLWGGSLACLGLQQGSARFSRTCWGRWDWGRRAGRWVWTHQQLPRSGTATACLVSPLWVAQAQCPVHNRGPLSRWGLLGWQGHLLH